MTYLLGATLWTVTQRHVTPPLSGLCLTLHPLLHYSPPTAQLDLATLRFFMTRVPRGQNVIYSFLYPCIPLRACFLFPPWECPSAFSFLPVEIESPFEEAQFKAPSVSWIVFPSTQFMCWSSKPRYLRIRLYVEIDRKLKALIMLKWGHEGRP